METVKIIKIKGTPYEIEDTVARDKMNSIPEIEDSLSSDSTTKALSAHQGAVLNNKITGVDNSLAEVAKTGSYNDLKDKPIISSSIVAIDDLNSEDTVNALSANQGRVLNEKINSDLADLDAEIGEQITLLSQKDTELSTAIASETTNREAKDQEIFDILGADEESGLRKTVSENTSSIEELTSRVDDLESAETGLENRVSSLEEVQIPEIIDNLDSTATDKALSANQGRTLNESITTINTTITTIEGNIPSINEESITLSCLESDVNCYAEAINCGNIVMLTSQIILTNEMSRDFKVSGYPYPNGAKTLFAISEEKTLILTLDINGSITFSASAEEPLAASSFYIETFYIKKIEEA